MSIPGAAFALDNAGFDTDLSVWSNLFNRPVRWDPADASGDPASGSALVDNPFPGNGGAMIALLQCEVVIPNQTYRFGTRAQMLPDAPAGATAEVIASFFMSSDCSDAPLVTYFGASTAATDWNRISGQALANPDAGSIRVSLAVGKEAGVDELASARFDDVFLTMTPLFRSGFE